MGKSERKIALKARIRVSEAAEKRMARGQAIKQGRRAKSTDKTRDAVAKKIIEEEAREKARDIERKRPLKKAISISKVESKKEEEKVKSITEQVKRKRKREPKNLKEEQTQEKENQNVKEKKVKKEPKIKFSKIGAEEEVIKMRPWSGEPIEEILYNPIPGEEIKKEINEMAVEGRAEEIKEISKYLFDTSKHTIYIHGTPGTGKTYVLEKIGKVLGKNGVEVYYSNLLVDKGFRKIGANSWSVTIVLIVDEFEGSNKDKFFVRQKAKLERQFKREGRPAYRFKVILISNEYNSKGVQFKPYDKVSVKQIVESSEQKERETEVEELLKVSEGVEKRDLRAVINKKIEQVRVESSEELGQYHQFIKKQVQAGKTDINTIYSDFLHEMKEKGVSVMPKEIIKEIIEGYLDGTLL